MTNMLGETVVSRILPDSDGQLEFNVEDLGAGVYFVHLANEHQHQTIRLVVTR